MSAAVRIVPMTDEHAARVLEIYAQGIATGVATFETQAPDWAAFDAGHFPDARLVALVGPDVAGWLAVSPYSKREAYRGVAWESVYVDERFRGRGVGRALLDAGIAAAAAAGLWTLLAGIQVENPASIALHERAGFRRIGHHERIGRDATGAWRDVVLMEWRRDD